MTMTITMIACPASSLYTDAPNGMRDASGCSEPRLFRSPVHPSTCTGPVLDNPSRGTDCESSNHRLHCPRGQSHPSISAMSGLTVGTAGSCVRPSITPEPSLELFSMRPSSKQPPRDPLGETTGTDGSGHARTVGPYNLLDPSWDIKRCTISRKVQFRQFLKKLVRQEIDDVLAGLMPARSHRDKGEKNGSSAALV